MIACINIDFLLTRLDGWVAGMVTSFCLASRDRCVLRFQVCQDVGCHQHFAEQGRQWLEAKLTNLRGDVQVDLRWTNTNVCW